MATSLINNERARGLFYQALLIGALAALIGAGWRNAVVNMEARGIPMGFGFWDETAGFAINQSLIDYSALSTYGRAFWVGLCNTLLVSAISIALATPLGFAVGVARLSHNWILAKIALLYVEVMRNTPLLLQLLFWYNAVLKSLPGPRQSLDWGGLVLANNRGLYLPRPEFGEGAWAIAPRARGGRRRRARLRRPCPAPPEPHRRACAGRLVRSRGDPCSGRRSPISPQAVRWISASRGCKASIWRADCSSIPNSRRWCSGS